jgi:alpha-amylase
MNSTRENYFGDNLLGARGNDEFFHPEVVAVNNFRKDMNGQLESVAFAENGETVAVSRGDKGVALINFSGNANEVSLAVTLPDGEYSDKVYGKTFQVQSGIMTGNAEPHATYIISL